MVYCPCPKPHPRHDPQKTRVALKLRYQAFADYADLAAVANHLDAVLAAKLGRYFNVNLNAILLYDQALTPTGKSPATQVSFVSGIGFLYTF